MDESVQDGVSERRACEVVMPVLDGKLARDERRAAAIPIFQYFQQVAPLRIGERSKPPVIQDEQIRFCEFCKQPGVGAVRAGHREIAQEPAHAEVARGVPAAARGLSQSTREIGFADTRGTDNEHGLVLPDPFTAGEPHEHGAIESAGGAEVHILDARIHAQSSFLKKPLEPAVIPPGQLAFDQQSESIIETEFSRSGVIELLFERLGHTAEPEFMKTFECVMQQHRSFPLFRIGSRPRHARSRGRQEV